MQNQIEEILSGGYEPPIKTVIGEAKTEIDNGVYKAVCQIGIRVDKEELLRALQYDRGQYDKGFADGVRQGQQGWISVEERLPEREGKYFAYTRKGTIAICDYRSYLMTKEGALSEPQFDYWVTHWMPMPKPPKGE